MSEYLNRAYLPILNIAGFDGNEQSISRFIRTSINRFRRKSSENANSLDTDDSKDRVLTDVSPKSDEEDEDSVDLHVHDFYNELESQSAHDATR